MTTGKAIALTRWTFVSKTMSLLFNMLSRLVITFLPRSKCLNFMAVVTEVILEPKGKEPKYFEQRQILSLGQELNKLIIAYVIVTESKEVL